MRALLLLLVLKHISLTVGRTARIGAHRHLRGHFIVPNVPVEKILCLRAVTSRSSASLKVLEISSAFEWQWNSSTECKRPQSSYCWRAGHGTNTKHIAGNRRDILVSSKRRGLDPLHDSPSASNATAGNTSKRPIPTKEHRFRLVLSPDSSLTAKAIAKKLDLLESPLQVSPSLMKLLDASQASASCDRCTNSIDYPSNHSTSPENGEQDMRKDRSDPSIDTSELDPAELSDIEIEGCGLPRSIARSGLDLSGTWKPIVSSTFLESYDIFLQACGESYWMRKLLVNAVGMQTQEVRQYEDGKRLEIVDIHPVARWNRTIIASGTELDSDTARYIEHVNTMIDPQGDELQVVANWCRNGSIHRSVLKTSKARLQDAWLETNRYMEKIEPTPGEADPSHGDSHKDSILVCESIFHPPPENSKLRPASIVWKYERL